MKYLLLFLCCCFVHLSWSQDKSGNQLKIDEIHLHDGSILKGKILKWRADNTIKVRLWTGATVNFSGQEMSKIVQTTTLDTLSIAEAKVHLSFIGTGFYTTLYAGGLNGSSPWSSEYVLGATLNGLYGYQFNEKYSLGLGSGIDYYYINQREMILPVFLETRYILKTHASLRPFLALSSGYGFGLKDKTWNLSSTKGGLMLHPAIGVQFGNTKHYNWILDVGVRLQRASFTFDSTPSWLNADTEFIEHRMRFRRLAVRLGMMF